MRQIVGEIVAKRLCRMHLKLGFFVSPDTSVAPWCNRPFLKSATKCVKLHFKSAAQRIRLDSVC